MAEVVIWVGDGQLPVDVCKLCQVAWFDPGEYRQLDEKGVPAPAARELPMEVRQMAAEVELKRIDRRRNQKTWDGALPDEHWKVIPALFGMPVEHDTVGIERLPIVTWSLALMMCLVTAVGLFDMNRAVSGYGWIPADPLRFGGLTLVSGFLLHGSILHLVGNVYFLLTFGDNVEDWLGSPRYLGMIVLAELAANVGHLMLAPAPLIPVVGASGAISGIIACYAVRFPRAKMGVLFGIFYVRRWISAPAYAMFAVWAMFQVFLAFRQVSGGTNVSAGAHIAGAAIGIVVAWRCRD